MLVEVLYNDSTTIYEIKKNDQLFNRIKSEY